jgi:hypothetical protein
MLWEILLLSGYVVIGEFLASISTYAVYKKGLTTRVLIWLLPGIFCLCVTLFIVGKFGAYNPRAVAFGLIVGPSSLLINLILLARRIVTPITSGLDTLCQLQADRRMFRPGDFGRSIPHGSCIGTGCFH